MTVAKRKEMDGERFAAGAQRQLPVSTPEPTPLIAYIAIAALSASVLIFELALTRIFSVMLWSNLAFMVVGTALFGFGLSGVYLALRPDPLNASADWFRASLVRFGLLMSASMIGSYLVVSYIPFRMWQPDLGVGNVLGLAAWELGLVAPFFCAGLCIARILSSYPRNAGSLYGTDLIAAAAGSMLFVPIITGLGGPAAIVVAALVGAVASLLLSFGLSRALTASGIAVVATLAVLLVQADNWLDVRFHQGKRTYLKTPESDHLFASRWSPLSRVDISEDIPSNGPLRDRETRAVWIDGGTNASAILKVEGSVRDLPPQDWNALGAAHSLKQGTNPRVLIIGAAGGRETVFALSFGAGHVDSLEMDPSVFQFMNEPELSAYMGGAYQDPRVSFINDEGRSFLRRTALESYDIIQSVNNYTPAAMAAGALNVSETFLLTKEAFLDYFDHLTPNGVIALHRGAALRVALTAMMALRERGVDHPERCIVITNGDFDNFQGIYIKKQPWAPEEVEHLDAYLGKIRHYGDHLFLWAPAGDHYRDPIFTRVLTAEPDEQVKLYNRFGVDLTPATDDHPFIEHYTQYGRQNLSKNLPPEFLKREREKWRGIIPRGDFPYVVILAESAALALLFVGLPLLLWARGGVRAEGFFGYLGYFAALGFSFIVVEICLMKRFVLFLGHPAYSVTAILVYLLLGAGIGSILSERLGKDSLRKTVIRTMAVLALFLVLEASLSPFVFRHTLGLSLAGRLAVAGALLVPLGVVMGLPFSLGLRMINSGVSDAVTRRQMLAWAWGMNGYATVIGSALTLFLALSFGFERALWIATAGYMVGFVCLLAGTRRAVS